MTIEIARDVGPSKLEIAYERLGDPHAPAVVLVMGLGAQLIAWPDGFCHELLQRGVQLVRFDNRDVGQSTHVTAASYSLSDMAADAVGLLDALGLDRVHLVGASLGGFVSQTIAIEHAARVRTLTSIMSSTGDRAVGQPHADALGMFAKPPPVTREQQIERTVEIFRLVGSPGFPFDAAAVAERAGRAYDRAFDPAGVMRQAGAVMASGDRTAKLRALAVPTLVIHGAADKLVDVSGGRATAAAIPGAELVVIDGMGHDLPRATWPQIATKIAALIAANPA